MNILYIIPTLETKIRDLKKKVYTKTVTCKTCSMLIREKYYFCKMYIYIKYNKFSQSTLKIEMANSFNI